MFRLNQEFSVADNRDSRSIWIRLQAECNDAAVHSAAHAREDCIETVNVGDCDPVRARKAQPSVACSDDGVSVGQYGRLSVRRPCGIMRAKAFGESGDIERQPDDILQAVRADDERRYALRIIEDRYAGLQVLLFRMSKLIYITNTSLDGYIEDKTGAFDWGPR